MVLSFKRLKRRAALAFGVGIIASVVMGQSASQFILPAQASTDVTRPSNPQQSTQYRTIKIDGLDIFYREAGDPSNPTILLLHGYPTSSHMFRNLIPALSDRYHLIAPDYPGFGNSSMPTADQFNYTFDNLARVMDKFVQAIGLEKYSLYMMDYGAPIGFRLATQHPEKVQALLIQNGNAYEEGLQDFWNPLRAYWSNRSKENEAPLRQFMALENTKWQYVEGTRDPEKISPDNWNMDQRFLDRPDNTDIQLALFYDYQTNVSLYPQWQKYLRERQPPTLIAWGKNDVIFPESGAHPYKKDLKTLDFNLLDTGHFALEEDVDKIASLIRQFLAKHL
ncbi:alpha/beta hydrolase [Acaryochloris sp. IP29b_bin.137]|uniref:alpha/beta fold hydrolase n=1 Tax=Acaryochloris sp. IP29b_bin.137 TaxID=2969217 RepID=UPI00261EAF3B|nr:alpha/beta hydrolase [Acaryochloris sp. IP29b_bin.137]